MSYVLIFIFLPLMVRYRLLFPLTPKMKRLELSSEISAQVTRGPPSVFRGSQLGRSLSVARLSMRHATAMSPSNRDLWPPQQLPSRIHAVEAKRKKIPIRSDSLELSLVPAETSFSWVQEQ